MDTFGRMDKPRTKTAHGAAIACAFLAAGFAGFAQTPAFEVATIKPAPTQQELMQQIQSGKLKLGMSVDGAQVNLGLVSLSDLIVLAYDIKPYQLQGPDWMSQQRFAIQAKLPEGATEKQVPDMMKALLADRFKLTVHHDKKDASIYALIVGKDGPKLIEASSAPEADLPDTPNTVSVDTGKGQMKMVQDRKGGMAIQGGGTEGTVRVSTGPNGIHMEMTRVTIPRLVETLSQMVDKPILDMTGLKGTYQFAMDLPMEEMLALARKSMSAAGIQLPGPGIPVSVGTGVADAASTPGGAGVFQAVEKLGLKLDSRKAPIDLIVVDLLEKNPTDN